MLGYGHAWIGKDESENNHLAIHMGSMYIQYIVHN